MQLGDLGDAQMVGAAGSMQRSYMLPADLTIHHAVQRAWNLPQAPNVKDVRHLGRCCGSLPQARVGGLMGIRPSTRASEFPAPGQNTNQCELMTLEGGD